MTTDEPTDDEQIATARGRPGQSDGVPPDKASYDCAYCGQPFARERYRTLHVGLDHHDECTEAEVEAFQDAYREEGEEIRLFRLKAIGGLVLLYFGFLFTYSIVT